MFPDLQLEVLNRFTSVDQYLRKSPRDYGGTSDAAKVSRGLVFVQIYAIYEDTVKKATQIAIEQIVSHGHNYTDLSGSLKAIFLDPQLRAIRDCGEDRLWELRLDLFRMAKRPIPITAVNVMPHDGSHFRYTQIEIILEALGVKKRLTKNPRFIARINEVVVHRNAISHGTATPAEIGRRFTRGETMKCIRFMQVICLRFLKILSDHCGTASAHLDA
jgi:hypothetical protein